MPANKKGKGGKGGHTSSKPSGGATRSKPAAKLPPTRGRVGKVVTAKHAPASSKLSGTSHKATQHTQAKPAGKLAGRTGMDASALANLLDETTAELQDKRVKVQRSHPTPQYQHQHQDVGPGSMACDQGHGDMAVPDDCEDQPHESSHQRASQLGNAVGQRATLAISSMHEALGMLQGMRVGVGDEQAASEGQPGSCQGSGQMARSGEAHPQAPGFARSAEGSHVPCG